MNAQTGTRPPAFEHVSMMKFAAETSDVPSRTITGWASTPDLDRVGEVIRPEAFARDLATYLENPIVTWAHNTYDVPIGVVRQALIDPMKGLWVEVKFADAGADPFADRVWAAISDGRVRSFSVGFNGQYTEEYGHYDESANVWVWEHAELREIAVVPIPANASAVFEVAKSLGLTFYKPHPGAVLEREEARCLENLERLRGASEGIDNIVRHWVKTGSGAPSAALLDGAVRPITVLASILKAGRVLSAANRAAIERARDALHEVICRDDESRCNPDNPDDDEENEKATIETQKPGRINDIHIELWPAPRE